MQQQIKLHNNFYNFLVKENLLEEYISELDAILKNKCNNTFYDANKINYIKTVLNYDELDLIIHDFKLIYYISKVLVWRCTDKGFDFWSEVASRLVDYVDSLINENEYAY